MTATELMAFEQKVHRGYFQRLGFNGESRVCDIPTATEPPITGNPIGGIMPGYAGEESDLLKPRLTGIKFKAVRMKGGVIQRATMTFLQPVALSGGIAETHFIELDGSRERQDGQFRNEATVIGITDSEAHEDVPKAGDTHPADSALDLPRMCSSVHADPKVVKGMFFVTAKYRGSIGE